MKHLHNVVQHYAWGNPSTIAELLGQLNPEERPYAELWMGTHPSGPSRVIDQNCRLDELLGHSLPFLMKVLAAAKPLSLQVHPEKAMAERGYRREEAAGLSRSLRSYHDENHKPELIYALEDFYALSGFRDASLIFDDLKAMGLSLSFRTLKECFTQWFSQKDISHVLPTILREVQGLSKTYNRFWWVQELQKFFSGDAGILSPIFLNLVHLSPGQVLFQAPGTLHSYLKGSGIEVMAASDNVLRGGCTEKHVDFDELLQVTSFDSGSPLFVNSHIPCRGVEEFPVPVNDFSLTRLVPDDFLQVIRSGSASILFCYQGSVQLEGHNHSTELVGGASLVLESSDTQITISGKGILFLASDGKTSQKFR